MALDSGEQTKALSWAEQFNRNLLAVRRNFSHLHKPNANHSYKLNWRTCRPNQLTTLNVSHPGIHCNAQLVLVSKYIEYLASLYDTNV